MNFINKIHQFLSQKKKKKKLLDSKDELDRHSTAHSLRLIVACIDPSSKEDEEMDINLRRGLKGLLAGTSKGASSKEVPKSQVPTNVPPLPPLPVTTVELLPCPDLKKKRKVQELEKGEMVPSKGAK